MFANIEKNVYSRVPREEVWHYVRTSGVVENCIRVVQDMYEGNETVVRCTVRMTEVFKVEVGSHQGSALISFLFAMVTNWLTDEIRQESPWMMMFIDDIIICREGRNNRWRKT